MDQNLRDHVRVHNEGEEDILVRYNSQPYLIPAKGDAIIPREAACKDFGDWTTRGKDRTKEHARLRGLYGALDGIAGDNERYESNRPKVRITEVSGEAVVSVMDDPKGENLPSDISRPQEIPEGYIEQIVEREIQRRLGQDESPQAAVAVPDDLPETAPRRTRKNAPISLPREE